MYHRSGRSDRHPRTSSPLDIQRQHNRREQESHQRKQMTAILRTGLATAAKHPSSSFRIRFLATGDPEKQHMVLMQLLKAGVRPDQVEWESAESSRRVAA